MNTIWKYVLEPKTTLTMPAGAKILSVGVQGEDICLWALVNPDLPTESRHFFTVGTGEWLSETVGHGAFIGTVHMTIDKLVFHVFEYV